VAYNPLNTMRAPVDIQAYRVNTHGANVTGHQCNRCCGAHAQVSCQQTCGKARPHRFPTTEKVPARTEHIRPRQCMRKQRVSAMKPCAACHNRAMTSCHDAAWWVPLLAAMRCSPRRHWCSLWGWSTYWHPQQHWLRQQTQAAKPSACYRQSNQGPSTASGPTRHESSYPSHTSSHKHNKATRQHVRWDMLRGTARRVC